MSNPKFKTKPALKLQYLLWGVFCFMVVIMPITTFAKTPLHRKVLVLFEGNAVQNEDKSILLVGESTSDDFPNLLNKGLSDVLIVKIK